MPAKRPAFPLKLAHLCLAYRLRQQAGSYSDSRGLEAAILSGKIRVSYQVYDCALRPKTLSIQNTISPIPTNPASTPSALVVALASPRVPMSRNG